MRAFRILVASIAVLLICGVQTLALSKKPLATQVQNDASCAPSPATLRSLSSPPEGRGFAEPVSSSLSATRGRRARDDRQELYRWFDTLGFTTILQSPLVEIDHWTIVDGSRKYSDPTFGFVIEGDEKTFRVLTLELDEMRVVDNRRPGTDPHYFLGCHPVDVRRWLEVEKASPSRPGTQVFGMFPSEQEVRARSFLVARIADLYGYHELADGFWTGSHFHSNYYRKTEINYADEIVEGFGRPRFIRAKRLLADPKVDRNAVVPLLQFIVDRFPPSPIRAQAESYLGQVKAMVAEDRARKPATSQQLLRKSEADRASELVWQLQDQHGYQMMEPGGVTIFGWNAGKGSPAASLVALGYKAVPALLDALHDKRFIRAIQTSFRIQDPRVLRVRDAAIQILAQIAGSPFYQLGEGVQGDDDATAAGIETMARGWWATAEKAGPRAMLIHSVKQGGWDASMMARTLVAQFPTDALDAIRAGVKASTDANVKANLIRSLGPLKSADAVRFAEEEMLRSLYYDSRLAGAEVVSVTNPNEADRAMVLEWQNLRRDYPDGSYGDRSLIDFLCGSGSPSVIDALRLRFKDHPVTRRMTVIEEVQTWHVLETWWRNRRHRADRSRAEKQAYDRSVEDFLAGSLSDQEQVVGTSGSRGAISFRDPRICDVASMRLVELWPGKYHYKGMPSVSSRDRECLENLNVWRRSRRLAETPLPPVRAVQAIGAGVINPLLNEIVSSGDSESARRKIFDLGLAALPPVAQRLDRAAEGSLEKHEFGPLCQELSCIVSEVTIKGASESVASLVVQVRNLKGKAFSSDWLHRFLSDALQKGIAAPLLFQLTATRDDDGSGVLLTVDFAPNPRQERSSIGINFQESVRAGPLNLSGMSAGMGLEEPYPWKYFEDAVLRALSSRWNAPLDIDIRAAITPINLGRQRGQRKAPGMKGGLGEGEIEIAYFSDFK